VSAALAVIDGFEVTTGPDPLLRDVQLAERLGYDRPRKLREIIRSLEKSSKLQNIQWRPAVGRQSTRNGGEREYHVLEAWLTRQQALKVIAKSETETADKMLDVIVDVFDRAVRGEFVAPPKSKRKPRATLEERVESMTGRLLAQLMPVIIAAVRTPAAAEPEPEAEPAERPALRALPPPDGCVSQRSLASRFGMPVSGDGAGAIGMIARDIEIFGVTDFGRFDRLQSDVTGKVVEHWLYSERGAKALEPHAKRWVQVFSASIAGGSSRAKAAASAMTSVRVAIQQARAEVSR